MKRNLYIIAFIVLGIILQFLLHAILEIWYISLLLSDFETYGLGLSWEAWILMHNIGAAVLFFAGALFGFFQGKFWWQRIYVEGRKRWGIKP